MIKKIAQLGMFPSMLFAFSACGGSAAPTSAPQGLAAAAEDELGAEVTSEADHCIMDIEAHARQTLGSDPALEGETPMMLTFHNGLSDLDGDGAPETIVFYESECGAGGNCWTALYLSNDGCPRQVLTDIFSGAEVLETQSNGVFDVELFNRDGCAGAAGNITTYVFDGESYQSTDGIYCECPYDEEDIAGRDPRCPAFE
ncbi:MAG: hypothetical protein KC561_16200 [Myxococcales bacterium]|nr:hypothetical protein [Myxococcales bacterium]